MKKSIKKNKLIYILLLLFLALLIGLFINLKEILYGDNASLYGNRLIGIEDVEVDEDNILDYFNEQTNINETTISISGKIINLHLDVIDGVSLEDAKGMALKSLDSISEKIREYYDIQFFITQKEVEDNNVFPIIGYIANDDVVISWIN